MELIEAIEAAEARHLHLGAISLASHHRSHRQSKNELSPGHFNLG
jgi:hypothetical protein